MSKKPKKMMELQLFKAEVLPCLPKIPSDLSVRAIKKGDLLSNGRSLAPYNVLFIEKDYPEDSAVDEIINEFIDNYFGEGLYGKLIDLLKPKQAFIRVHIPVRSSKFTQDDVIESATLAKLVGMGLDLDFWFT